jgi:aryl-alcohol dehydrogenase-like predicted oxidoreductase
MRTRHLGPLEVSAVGLGCMSLASMYGSTDEADAIATVRRALDAGITLFDTADVYGAGTSERLLGRALAGRREEAVIATKFGIVADPADYGRRRVSGRPEHVRRACEASLERLGVDAIDLYYQHRVDLEVPVEETWGAMAELVAAGKVRHLGISEPSADSLRRASSMHPVAAVQSEWSLWARDLEAEIVPLSRELGAGIVAYSPLGRGFLTGGVTSAADLAEGDFRRELPRFRDDNLARNRRLAEAVSAVAREFDVTAAQVALAWLLGRGDDVVPIPGTGKPHRAVENAEAAGLHLGEEVRTRLESVFAEGVAGARYADMAWVER